ncbi:MAG: DUF2263 domain-containing protein [Desulfobacteraceae bacterium]|nr:DUF2263 domain-containing protein [Desulfobacteraceae bacterium]
MNRKQRANLAQETLLILEKGFYLRNDGTKIEIKEELEKCKRNTILYKPDDFDFLKNNGSAAQVMLNPIQ